MDADGTPTLGVGFAIDTGGSFESLLRIERAMDATESKLLPAAARIERATSKMVDLDRPLAQFTTFANATTREMLNTSRAKGQVEKAGETLIRQLEREATTIGKTKAELRDLKIETQALAAVQVGNTDQADRLLAAARKRRSAAEAAAEALATESRQAEQAVEREAQAVREAAFAYQMFEARVRQGARAQRDREAAQAADAASAQRLRASTDPLFASTQRLNAELAESTRLYKAGVTPAGEYARQQDVLNDRIRDVTAQHERMGVTAVGASGALRGTSNSLRMIAVQMPDVVQGLLSGQSAMTVLIQQGGQIAQISMMAGIGLRQLATSALALVLPFTPVIAAIGAAAAGMGLFVRWVNQGVSNDQITRDLGKITGGANATKQELWKLREETITWGDTTSALFSVVGKDIADTFLGDIRKMVGDTKALLDDMTSYGKVALAGMYASLAGTKAYIGELSKPGAVTDLLTGNDPKLFERTYGAAYKQADAYLTKLGARVKAQALTNARERLADKIGYNNPEKPKTDRHAEQLARETAAMEAQIRGLYALTDAYGVSGAAALIAEARVKAETAAIKKRADVEMMVAQQVRLTIAQRIADAAKGALSMREEAAIQAGVNAEVASGNVTAERAADLLRDRIADLPLLTALEAAHTLKGREGMTAVTAATKALDEQRAARERLTDEQRKAQLLAALAAGDDRLATLREELRLVGATEGARVRALAILQATQQAERSGWTGKKGADFVTQQGQIADAQYQLKLRTDAANEALRYQVDLFDILADNVAQAGRGMEEAFGRAGGALGNLATTLTGYMADQKRLDAARRAELVLAADISGAEDRAAKERRINGLYDARNLTARIGLFGDMAGAARDFFGTESKGYRDITTALKIFRGIEFALSVRAVAQDAFETAEKVANSVFRTAKYAVEAVVKAIKELPFPLNLAAGAATAGAIAALGVSVAGGFGGGGSKPTPANDGSGTVLGDTKAQSESIRRAIDQLKEVDTLMLSHSREMAASLRSIDGQISGFASAILRTGDVNANANVPQGFKANAIGSVLGNIPLIGGLLKGLFGTSTTVTGSGLFGGAQSLGSVLDGGFDASYFSDVKKTKKFLGITTGTSYSTSYTGADAGLEKQFTLILRSFTDAIGAAAGPLGMATSDVEQRLRGFVVDIGKIDLQGLSGEQIEERLSAVFGATADRLAAAALPGFERFQKAGEGMFETIVRVASTVEAVTASLGATSRAMTIDAKLGLAAQFDSISDLTSAAGAYFENYYSRQEQAAARLAQFGDVFGSLGVTMPASLSAFRQLVDAQDLTTASGQATYATLLKLAPAFADLQEALNGAKSAADVLAERGDLERRLLELRGDTAAIRALDLAKLDASNRALQQQVWAVQDAQEAAKAADQLREAWTSVGDGIRDEIARIRGLTGTETGGFATLLGRFNAANTLARGGDMDAAKTLTGLSQALLTQAEKVATSRQELDRIRAQTATALEGTYGAIQSLSGSASPSASIDTLIAAVTKAQTASTPKPANDDTAAELRALRAEMAQLRADNSAGHANTAREAKRGADVLTNVTGATGGDAVQVRAVA